MNRSRKPLTKLQRFAKGKACMLRVPGVCRPAAENENTCLCHAPHPNRGGMRKDDEWGAVGCSECHDYVDSRMNQRNLVINLAAIWMPAIKEWQELLKQADRMQIEGVETVVKMLPRRY